jgi:outer membrane translocation and assembly module TamA
LTKAVFCPCRVSLFLLTALVSFAQAAEIDSTTKSRDNLVLLPIVSYSPETKLALGVFGAYYFRSEHAPDSIPPSAARATLAYTTRKQFLVQLSPDLYFDNARWKVSAELSFAQFADKFYGIGNATPNIAEEEYSADRIRAILKMQRTLVERARAGILLDYEHQRLRETKAGGILATQNINGTFGGSIVGYGVVATFDSRDNVFSSSSGAFIEGTATLYPRTLGSDFEFGAYTIDARGFLAVADAQVIAVQAYGRFSSGAPPFQRLAALGGSYRMRGLYEGRFRDQHMIELQGEYRFPLVARFGLAGFVGTGDVASAASAFRVSEMKYSVGAGLRYSISPQDKVNIRLDVAFASKSSSGVYFTIEEAF